MMQSILFVGGTLHDPRQDTLCHGVAVLLEDSLINEVFDRPCISLRGRAVSLGLIDAGGSVAMPAMMRACCFVTHAP